MFTELVTPVAFCTKKKKANACINDNNLMNSLDRIF